MRKLVLILGILLLLLVLLPGCASFKAKPRVMRGCVTTAVPELFLCNEF